VTRPPCKLNLTDRQTSLKSLTNQTELRVLVAHSAARLAWRADHAEIAICVNLASCGNAENSEGSDRKERLRESRILAVPIRGNGQLSLTALTGGAVRVRAVKWSSAL